MTFMKSIIVLAFLNLSFLLGCFHSEQKSCDYIPGSYKALELWNYQRAYPNKTIPSSGYYDAWEDHKRNFVQKTRNISDQWRPQGPLNTAGRTLTLAINPQNDSILYAGTASGGLWRSRSLGLGVTWERMETGFPLLGVSTIEFVPGDSTTMYIGTGEVYNIESTGTDGAERMTRGSYGLGILKSTDGGQTWEKSLDWTYQQQRGVWMIMVDPVNTSTIYAATTNGIYKSKDAGETWDHINTTVMATDIDIHPTRTNELVACFGNFDTPDKGIYFSDDGGATWEQTLQDPEIMTYQGKILLARVPSVDEIIYASVGNGFGFDDGATWLLKSEDGGQNWEIISETDYSKFQGWFAHDIAINPNAANELVAVGIEVWVSDQSGANLENTNRGNVTSGVPPIDGPDGPDDYVHSDIHFVMYHPNIEDFVLMGTDGGVFHSYDGGFSFRSANGGFQSTQFYNGFSVSDQDSVLVMGGLQDNSTVINQGGGVWRRAVGGDGSWSAIDAENDDLVYGSSQRLRILRSTNSGDNFQNNISPDTEDDDDPIFIAPYLSTRNAPRTLYACGRYVYKSIDRGNNWETVNGGEMIDGNRIFAIDDYDADENIVYLATVPGPHPGSIKVTRDGGDSWSGEGSGLPDRVPNDVVVFNEDPSVSFACYSGFGTAHLLMSTDWADTWTPMDAGLPDVPGNAIAIDEINRVIYYGTDLAVYYAPYQTMDGTFNTELDWQVIGTGLPSAVIAMDLKISRANGKLWVATHGNGAYDIDLVENIDTAVEEIVEANIKVMPNPTLDFLKIESDDKWTKWMIYSIDGQLISEGQDRKVDATILNPGTYNLVLFLQDGRTHNQKFIKI